MPNHLVAWTAAADSTQPDFLAVLDVPSGGEGDRYGHLVTTPAVPGVGNGPHHTGHEMPADGRLFTNGYPTGQTWIFDLATPEAPRLARQFGDLDGYSHPHSCVRLPGGNVLAVFQMRHEAGGMTPCAIPVVSGDHLVLTGYGAMENRVVLLTHDPATGALALDNRFREEGATVPGVRLAGVPHGAVFSRR